MSVSYSSFLFVGAEVPREHFYDVGNARQVCNSHGEQAKQFCGDCGRQCFEEFDKTWRPEMLKAAATHKVSPEIVWERLGGVEGDEHYLSYNKDEYGPLGFYNFGYDNEIKVFGIALTRMSGDDRFVIDKHSVIAESMPDIVGKVKRSFDIYSIELPIRIFAIQNCG